ncbi:hypothetical protein KQX54_013321 [Cotesia glomerata]|uniref:Uncharacterized protein n=1 Tax=Cotesia glomerata TaxID=32391 RepID=A0AAV7IMI3_COTGL|nr:hypothetical protein KQX54_013321 [Cotesia glomerata]
MRLMLFGKNDKDLYKKTTKDFENCINARIDELKNTSKKIATLHNFFQTPSLAIESTPTKPTSKPDSIESSSKSSC